MVFDGVHGVEQSRIFPFCSFRVSSLTVTDEPCVGWVAMGSAATD